MRSIVLTASCALLALPLIAVSPPAARADNDFLDQAKKFFNNDNDHDSNRDAYQRGRQDELRRQQTERDRHRWQRDHDRDLSRYDRSRDDRYRDPNYGYNNR